MEFNKWLDTFVSEKGLNTEEVFEVEGPSGYHLIPLGVVIEHMKITTREEQNKIKDMLVKIDCTNGDVVDFFRWLAIPITASV